MMNLGLLDLDAVVDVSHVDEARGVAEDDGYLRIGALTRHREVQADPLVTSRQPLLASAAGRVGSSRIRARGTLGGSLAHSDPAAELPLAMIALGATYEVTDGTAMRTVRADEFHVSYFTTDLGGRRAARRGPRADPRPRLGMGVPGGLAPAWRFRDRRRRGARPARRRRDRRVASGAGRRLRAGDAAGRRGVLGHGRARRRSSRSGSARSRGSTRSPTRARPPIIAGTWRGCSASAPSPMLAAAPRRPHERRPLRCQHHPRRERAARHAFGGRPRHAAPLAPRRSRRPRSEVRLRRRRVRRVHRAGRRRARERLHRAGGPVRRGRRSRRPRDCWATTASRARCSAPSTNTTRRSAASARRAC